MPSRRASPPSARPSCFRGCRRCCARRWPRRPMPSAWRASIPPPSTSRAALARLPLLRKSDLPALHKAAPPFGGLVSGPPGSFGRLFTSPGPIFEPEADPRRPLARRAGAVRRRLPARRRGAQHLQLSSDAGRLHLRRLGARARLRGDSGRSRQYRGAIRADRGLSPGRLQRHARISSRSCSTPPAAAGRDVSSIKRALVSGAAFPTSLQQEIKSRGRRRLPGLRHRRSRPDRLRDRGARGHGRQRGPDHGNRAARHRRSGRARRRRRNRRHLARSRITPGSASRSATSPRRCRAQARAAAPTCASRAGWAAPTRPPRSRACSCAPSRSPRSASAIPELGRLRLVVTRSRRERS